MKKQHCVVPLVKVSLTLCIETQNVLIQKKQKMFYQGIQDDWNGHNR